MLDTSTLILPGRLSDAAALPEESVIRASTLAELFLGPHVVRNEHQRAACQAHLQQAESDFDVLPFGVDTARAFGAIAASQRASGRKQPVRAYDTLAAASAIANRLSLITCNPMRFDGIAQLDSLTVPQPGHI